MAREPSYFGPSLARPAKRSLPKRKSLSAFESFPEKDFDRFVDDVSLKIKRALHLVPEPPADVFATEQPAGNAPSLYPRLPSPVAADDSHADASVLAEKHALPLLTTQGSQAETEEHNVKPEGEQDAASHSDDNDEESELESDTEKADPFPKDMPTKHTSTLLDEFPSGARDPVKRLRSKLDSEAQDTLYGSDSQGDNEILDEDDRDDVDFYSRIPTHLKGKGRATEDSEDEKWMQESDEDELHSGPNGSANQEEHESDQSDEPDELDELEYDEGTYTSSEQVIVLGSNSEEESLDEEGPPVTQAGRRRHRNRRSSSHTSLERSSKQREQASPDRDDVIIPDPPSDEITLATQDQNLPDEQPSLTLDDILNGAALLDDVPSTEPNFEDFYNQPLDNAAFDPSLMAAIHQQDADFTDFSAEIAAHAQQAQDKDSRSLDEAVADSAAVTAVNKEPEAHNLVSSLPETTQDSITLPKSNQSRKKKDSAFTIHADKHVHIGDNAEILIYHDPIATESTEIREQYIVEETPSPRSHKSMSPGIYSLSSYHEQVIDSIHPDEILSPPLYRYTSEDVRSPSVPLVETLDVVRGQDDNGILEVPPVQESEVALEEDDLREALPETTVPQSSFNEGEDDGLLHVTEEMVSEPNLLDEKKIEQYEEGLPTPLTSSSIPSPLPQNAQEDQDLTETVTTNAIQRPSNVLEPGEWDVSQPVHFGGASLEAAVREALYDPERRQQAQDSINEMAPSALADRMREYAAKAANETQDLEASQQVAAELSTKHTNEGKVSFPQEESVRETSPSVPQHAMSPSISVLPAYVEPSNDDIEMDQEEEESQPSIIEATRFDPFDIPDVNLISNKDLKTAQSGTVDLPPVSMRELAGGYALRDAILTTDSYAEPAVMPKRSHRVSLSPPRLPSPPLISPSSPLVQSFNSDTIDQDGTHVTVEDKNAASDLPSDLTQDDDDAIVSQLLPISSAQRPIDDAHVTNQAQTSSQDRPSRHADAVSNETLARDRQSEHESIGEGGLDFEDDDTEIQNATPSPHSRQVDDAETSSLVSSTPDVETGGTDRKARRRSSRLRAREKQSTSSPPTTQKVSLKGKKDLPAEVAYVPSSPKGRRRAVKSEEERTALPGSPVISPNAREASNVRVTRSSTAQTGLRRTESPTGMNESPTRMKAEEPVVEVPTLKVHAHGKKHACSLLVAQEAQDGPTRPVTRSHCTFRKISMPSSVNKNKTYHILVPECSLAGKDEELAADLVEDLGAARVEDHERATAIKTDDPILDQFAEAALVRIVGTDLVEDCEVLPEIVEVSVAKESPKKRKRALDDEDEREKAGFGVWDSVKRLFTRGRI